MTGRHMISAWSSTQGVIALSPGEAELYAMVVGATRSLGMISLAADFGVSLGAQIHGDSIATIGIVNRTGVGKLRHIRVQYLWLQERVKAGELRVNKVLGTENAADLFTKHVPEATMDTHLSKIGFEKMKDRPATAPALASLISAAGAARPMWQGAPLQDQLADQLRGREQADRWAESGDVIVRHHHRERQELFTPKYVENGPALKSLCSTRITEGHFIDNGETFKCVDSWTARPRAHLPLERAWQGTTTFFLRVGV